MGKEGKKGKKKKPFGEPQRRGIWVAGQSQTHAAYYARKRSSGDGTRHGQKSTIKIMLGNTYSSVKSV